MANRSYLGPIPCLRPESKHTTEVASTGFTSQLATRTPTNQLCIAKTLFNTVSRACNLLGEESQSALLTCEFNKDGRHPSKRADNESCVRAVSQSHMSAIKSSRREIVIPDGYELAGYTLQRVDDGHLQHYLPVDVSATPVQAIPLAGYLSDIFVSTAGSLSPAPVTKHASYQDQQPIQEENESLTHSNIKARKLSATTQDRHAHSRDDNYTDVCGVFSSAKATPVKKYNAGNGEFYCPRCGSNYTRPKSVKDHFPHCVSKFGNPQAFRFTDHPSMAQTEAAIQRRRQASLENSNSDTEGNDTEGYHVEGDEDSQGFSFEKINETLYVQP